MFNKYVAEIKEVIGNCEIKEVVKNGVSFTGLMIGTGAVRPTVYLNKFFMRA